VSLAQIAALDLDGQFVWPKFVASVLGDASLIRAMAVWDAKAKRPDWLRAAALESLAEKWPDESTRALLRSRAVEDQATYPRSAALRTLAKTWPDESTRELLRARAVEDQDADSRRAALQSLAKTWPDESTRELLRARAVEDQSEVIRGTVCSALGGMHSQLGRIVGTKDLDGTAPYLDPLLPLTSEHIQKGAERVGIAATDLEAQIHSLNLHLGWDIRVGARSS
ncbi:MAG TPA: HEAT repeat domain-containing protein, partial [Hydrogenophaga sp.]